MAPKQKERKNCERSKNNKLHLKIRQKLQRHIQANANNKKEEIVVLRK